MSERSRVCSASVCLSSDAWLLQRSSRTILSTLSRLWNSSYCSQPSSRSTMTCKALKALVKSAALPGAKVDDPTVAANAPVTVTTTGPVNYRWTIAAVEIRAAG